ncbi:hypothetical protein [Streptomyces sp. NBC_00083]|uniref:hypothetical protein n=1 Tax=Streptomyces sp. NBC_00083 TaxID=2975647 RepID=UPI0022546F4C|nr:hypothetical protein [Streptomyces sp. NBC_00083]MCX5385623.1 hypothetical protein [Streptomyces sp. NBC_00083]
MVRYSIGAVVIFALLGLYWYADAKETGSTGDLVMCGFLGIAALFVVQRCLLLPSKAWVRFDGDVLEWRTHKSLLKQEVSPSGSVALRDIVAAEVIVQHPTSRVLWTKRQVEMRAVCLELTDGENVVLPIRGLALRLSAGTPFRRLLDELRRRRPELAQGLAVAVQQ